MAKTGNEFYALDGATGQILWSAPAIRPDGTNSSVNSGPAVVNGSAYWGTGYARAPGGEGNGNTRLYAFSIDGK
jgi:polyvinyl alcohol dehydrogenase (cytochrome)